MSLAPGTRLAHYEIVEPIGKGGMGEVYRARDTKLGREVAIKVLPDAFSQNEERLARFEREARLLASLNHPNIATIHGLEESDGTRFLVMELVEGETLQERIAKGPVPVDEALPLFAQIAEALAFAHQKGVIHRDVKPANLKLTPEGEVKVLDFGLAKAFGSELAATASSESPTVTREATETGVIMGTAAYMSPEQARGKSVDERTDNWSFGCVLYEALTGKVAFQGETISDTIAKILEREPEWEDLPPTIPPSVGVLLRRCLEKDPERRKRDMADARIEIVEALSEPATSAASLPQATRRAPALPIILLAGVAALLASLVVWNLKTAPPRRVVRFDVSLPPQHRLDTESLWPVGLSPDGEHLVYAADGQLYRRTMDELEATPIRGTEGAHDPFFSPDGHWVGFWTGSDLKKVPLSGGPSQQLCSVAYLTGVVWGPDDILFFSNHENIFRVPATGGEPELVISVDLEAGETDISSLEILSDGDTLLFTLHTGRGFDNAHVVAQSVKSGERRQLLDGGSNPRYVPTGHLLYYRENTLMAVPFDPNGLEVRGSSVPLVENVSTGEKPGVLSAYFSVFRWGTGSLVYVPRSDPRLVWLDREGRITPLSAERALYLAPRIAPDGRRVAVHMVDSGLAGGQIWVLDIERGTRTRLTFDGRVNFGSVWSPDV